MPIKETPGGLGNAGYISGKAVEREQARLAREAAARVPFIPTIMHMRSADDSIVCPVSPRPFPSQITDDPHDVTCAHCLKIMNEDTACKGEGDRDSLCENCQESADSEPDAV